jgi:hypothetical protein
MTTSTVRALGEVADADWTDGEITVDSGLRYATDDPVLVRIRRRGRRYDLTDDGVAVQRAGRPPGWHPVLDRTVAAVGLNVNRRGVVFVPAVAGRDIAALALRVAEASRAGYLALLDLGS